MQTPWHSFITTPLRKHGWLQKLWHQFWAKSIDRWKLLRGKLYFLWITHCAILKVSASDIPTSKSCFCQKSTTSRLQPLDAGIIRNFKLKYRKKLLKFVISRINDNVKATDIIEEVDVLKAISWTKSAWGEVSEEAIVNYFKKCRFRKSQLDDQLTDFAEEE